MKSVQKSSVLSPTIAPIGSGKVSIRRKSKNMAKGAKLPPTPDAQIGLNSNKSVAIKKKTKGKHKKSGGIPAPDPVGENPKHVRASEEPSSSSVETPSVKKRREKFQNSKNSTLRERMLGRLSAARFRFINEELYSWDGEENPIFAKDPKAFSAYHSGFKQQTKLWPINPIDVIIKSIKNLPNHTAKVIADFGCGEAKLAHELSSNKVFSFDLVALNDKVTVADNANVKLYSGSVDVAVHCLSLMSSKISAYVKEANRVLKTGGLLKIAEVESRFEDVDKFASNVCKFNFKLVKKDLSHNLFYFLDFEKLGDIGVSRKRKLPILTLQPCLYKKRLTEPTAGAGLLLRQRVGTSLCECLSPPPGGGENCPESCPTWSIQCCQLAQAILPPALVFEFILGSY